MKCIVLSGATVPFQALVDAIDSQLTGALMRLGFSEIEVQYGHATPPNTGGVHYFAFDPEIATKVQSAQLVISHAGTGSILDAVERGSGMATRKVLVVVNDKLMDNHQLEVASKLEALGCLHVCSSPALLADALNVVMNRQFAKLESPSSLQAVLDDELARKWE